QLGDDAVAAQPGEHTPKRLVAGTAPMDLTGVVYVLQLRHRVDEQPETVRGRADPADRGEPTRRDVAVVTDHLEPEAVPSQPLIDVEQPRSGLHRAGA